MIPPRLQSCLPLIGLLLYSAASAQVPPVRPALDQLSRETQSLYLQLAQSAIRVQLPTTRPAAVPPAPAELNLPASRPPGALIVGPIVPATAPVRPPAKNAATQPVFLPNVIGVVVDDQGFAMLPLFTTRANAGTQPIPVMLCDGSFTQARFVGSDGPTNITVIQVLRAGLKPMILSTNRPAEGTLVLSLPVDIESPRLEIWSRFSSDLGLVVLPDGSLCGFSSHSHFMSVISRVAIVRQLIEHGQIERPHLGVRIKQIMPDDPQRLNPALGQTPSIRIYEVFAGTAAAKAGLQAGDVILTLAGEPVGDGESFAVAIADRHGPTELKILRGNDLLPVTVDLQPPP